GFDLGQTSGRKSESVPVTLRVTDSLSPVTLLAAGFLSRRGCLDQFRAIAEHDMQPLVVGDENPGSKRAVLRDFFFESLFARLKFFVQLLFLVGGFVRTRDA